MYVCAAIQYVYIPCTPLLKHFASLIDLKSAEPRNHVIKTRLSRGRVTPSLVIREPKTINNNSLIFIARSCSDRQIVLLYRHDA